MNSKKRKGSDRRGRREWFPFSQNLIRDIQPTALKRLVKDYQVDFSDVLGCGSFACAFSAADQKVLKVSISEIDSQIAQHLANLWPSDKNVLNQILAKVDLVAKIGTYIRYSGEDDVNQETRSLYGIVMQRLSHLTDQQKRIVRCAWTSLRYHKTDPSVSLETLIASAQDEYLTYGREPLDWEVAKTTVSRLLLAAKIPKKFGLTYWDFNPENWGLLPDQEFPNGLALLDLGMAVISPRWRSRIIGGCAYPILPLGGDDRLPSVKDRRNPESHSTHLS